MAITNFDIQKILSFVFGGNYNGLPFPGDASLKIPSQHINAIIDGLNHSGRNGVYYMTPVSLNGWQLPNEPLISLTNKKTIVKTALSGNTRRGTVKEIINTGDYNIKIRGVIKNEDSKDYPFYAVEKLKELYEVDQNVSIVNAITDIFEIKQVVIEEIDIPEMVGRPNLQAYQISCVSDEDFVLVKQ